MLCDAQRIPIRIGSQTKFATVGRGYYTRLFVGLRPTNERRRYKVTPSVFGWAETWNQPCNSDIFHEQSGSSWPQVSAHLINLSDNMVTNQHLVSKAVWNNSCYPTKTTTGDTVNSLSLADSSLVNQSSFKPSLESGVQTRQLNAYMWNVIKLVILQCSMRTPSISLQWRHSERDGVSHHQPHDCLLNRLFKAQIIENIKAPRHWPLCGEFTGDRWIPRTKGQ